MDQHPRAWIHRHLRGGDRLLRLGGLIALLAACREDPQPLDPQTADASIEDAASDASIADASIEDAGSDDAGVAPWELALEVLRVDGQPARLYVPVVFDQQDGYFIVDTGSQVTFVPLGPNEPDYVPNYSTIELGGRTVSVAGRNHAIVEEHAGLPILGILGNDILLARAWELDLPGGRMIAPDDLSPYEAWSRLSFENVFDFLFAPATVDGAPLRLAIDTGATHLLWLGMDGRPGDIEEHTMDALGNPVTLYLGTAALLMAGEPERTIPIWRTLSFPAIEQSNMQIGGQIDGIIGLTTLGDRRILLLGPLEEIRLQPN